METILSVKNLSVRLGGEVILKNLSFELGRGENLSVIGPNGSGKTVLLKTLLGMLPHQGEIAWGADTRIGYVPQKVEAEKHFPLNLSNLLDAKAELLGIPRSDIKHTVEAVGLTPEMLKVPIGHLSGGQFQKSLIAFALLGRPTVLLFDEPTASIDQPGEEKIYELMARLQEKYNLTVLLVSHDLSLVYRHATKVLCLNRQKFCFGSPREVLDPKTLEGLYGLGAKYYEHRH